MEPAVPDTKDAAHPAQDLKAGVSGALRWFGASTGIIGIALYVCGFLITIAQTHLLGIGRLVSYSHDEYVQQGGTFLYDIGATVIIAAVAFSVIVVVVAIIGARAASRRVQWGKRHRRCLLRIRRCYRQASPYWPPVAYLALLTLLLWRYTDWAEFGRPLSLSDILFHKSDDEVTPAVRDLYRMLLTDAKQDLAGMFEDRLLQFVGCVLLFLAAYHVTRRQSWRRPALAPFLLLTGLYASMLPLLYGVLKVHMEFPVVLLWPPENPKNTGSERCLLLSLNDQVAVLYIPSDRKVLWRRRDKIDRLDVLGAARILNEIGGGRPKP